MIETKNPVLLRKTVSTETSELVKTYLQAVMQYGTGKRAQVEGYDIGRRPVRRRNFHVKMGNIFFLISDMLHRRIRKLLSMW